MTPWTRLVDLFKLAEKQPGRTEPGKSPPAHTPWSPRALLKLDNDYAYHWHGCGSCPGLKAHNDLNCLDDEQFARAIKRGARMCAHCQTRWEAGL